jgi:hypothetical protein
VERVGAVGRGLNPQRVRQPVQVRVGDPLPGDRHRPLLKELEHEPPVADVQRRANDRHRRERNLPRLPVEVHRAGRVQDRLVDVEPGAAEAGVRDRHRHPLAEQRSVFERERRRGRNRAAELVVGRHAEEAARPLGPARQVAGEMHRCASFAGVAHVADRRRELCVEVVVAGLQLGRGGVEADGAVLRPHAGRGHLDAQLLLRERSHAGLGEREVLEVGSGIGLVRPGRGAGAGHPRRRLAGEGDPAEIHELAEPLRQLVEVHVRRRPYRLGRPLCVERDEVGLTQQPVERR